MAPEFRNVTKSFGVGESRLTALSDVSFKAAKGAFIAVFGPSGCGKSTLLNMTAGLCLPSSGEV